MRRIALFFLLAFSSIPLPAQIPAPESVLGHRVGDDFYLATYEESYDYFQKLAAASDRVELREIGTTSFGRPLIIALISSPENLARVDGLREDAQRLAWARDLDDDAARKLAREGRAFVHIDGGLHASEVAHAQHNIQLAYDLASETEDPEILTILDEVVLILWPSMNPDGQTMIADWYRSNLGTPYEVAPMPRLYQKYVGHDNNRDGYMLNTHETRVVTKTIREWEPQVLYNHHQTAPFPARIWIPPFAEPVSPHVHPLMWRTVNLMGMAMAQALEERGRRGAMHMGTGFDNWYPGFLDHANNFHNVASFLTETGLYRYATPHFYTVDDFPKNARDLRPGSLYASPWEGGWWRLRDAVDYMLTASISVLDTAAKYREDLLYNRYQAGRDVAQRYREHPPYAYFIPQDQRDPVAAVELLRRLAYNGIEVSQLDESLEVEGRKLPAGTWAISMDQPFAHFVRQLFEIQSYPDLGVNSQGAPDQPYDVAGWTLPLQMGVHVVTANSPIKDWNPRVLGGEIAENEGATFDSPLGVGFDDHPIAAAIVPPPGGASGGGAAIHLDPAQNNVYRVLHRAWDDGATVRWKSSSEGGRFVVSGLDESHLKDLAVRARRGPAEGAKIERPRVGLYRPFAPSMDEGWTRWLLERYETPFVNLDNAQVRAGRLDERVDVLILPAIRSQALLDGFAKGTVPPRWEGGLDGEGVRAIDAFIRGGGTLVAFNQSARFAIDELHLPVRNAVAGLKNQEFFLSGSIVEMIASTEHPLLSGMPERTAAMVEASPVFEPADGFEGSVLLHYPEQGSPLLSGYLLGEEHLQGKASAIEVRRGDGRVILFGLRPQWRGQPFGTFRLVFNAALYGPSLAAQAPEPKTQQSMSESDE